MIKILFFRDHIVVPSLQAINSYTPERERLNMATAMAESELEAVRQRGSGPALGYWQMEPATHDDIWSNFLGATSRAHLLDGLRSMTDRPGDPRELEVNPFYACAMCAIHYLRFREALPHRNDIEGMARYWKKYYNTFLGRGTVDGFIAKAAAAFKL